MMDVFRSAAARYVLVVVCAAVIAAGAYAAASAVLARQASPGSALDRGNQPPPRALPGG